MKLTLSVITICLFALFSCDENRDEETETETINTNPIQQHPPYVYYFGEEDPPAMCGPAGAHESVLPDGRIILVEIPTLCSVDPWHYDDEFEFIEESHDHEDIMFDEKEFIDVTITPE
jgi:hypothetical protein